MAEHRSGTVPFMAREVLDQRTNGYVHRLHHDLESVLYMCVWHAYDYTLENVPRDRQTLNEWRCGSWQNILRVKSSFFKDADEANLIIGKIPDGTHLHKSRQLHAAFEIASVENNMKMSEYNHNLIRVRMDMQAAWIEKTAVPSTYAVYATFPAIMEMLGEEAKACTKDCCVLPTPKSQ